MKPARHLVLYSYLWSSLNRGLSRLSKLLAVASALATPLKGACFRSDGASEGGRDTGAAAIMFARERGMCVQAEVVE